MNILTLSQSQLVLLAKLRASGLEDDFVTLTEIFGSARGDYRRQMENLQFSLACSTVKLITKRDRNGRAYKLVERKTRT